MELTWLFYLIFHSCMLIAFIYWLAKHMKKLVLCSLEISESTQVQVLSPFAQWPMWCMTTSPARILDFTDGHDP